jgi:hypothetical protein
MRRCCVFQRDALTVRTLTGNISTGITCDIMRFTNHRIGVNLQGIVLIDVAPRNDRPF